MATNIVQSLFGVSPESYQQEQSAMADQRAMQYARLDPFQQANYGIARGAYGLAGAVGGALGGQDPELQKISARNSIAKQIDFSDLNSIAQGVQMLGSSGDTVGAMQLQQILLDQKAKLASIGKDVAAGKASLAQAGREKVQASPKEVQLAREVALLTGFEEGTPQYNTAFATSLQEQMAKPVEKPLVPKIQEVGTAVKSGKAVYTYQTGDSVQQITFETDDQGKQVMKPYVGAVDRTTAKVSATATGAQQDDFAKVLNKKQGDAYSNAIDLRDNAITAVKTFNTLGQLDDQGLISGSFATGRVGATNLLNTLGLVTPANVATLARSENYVKVAGDAILSALGGKLGAQISDSDVRFIKGLVPQLENSAAARRQLIDYMRKKNVELIDSSTELIDYAETKKTLSVYKPKIPLPNLSKGIYSNLSDAELDQRIKDARNKK
jgi:hypothetical protein